MNINKIKQKILLPYPLSESKKEIIISSLLIGLSVYFFLLIFQPFGTNTVSFYTLLYVLLPYVIIVFLSFYSVNIFFYNKNCKWTLLHEIVKVVLAVSFCSILCYVYNASVVSRIPMSLYNFFFMFFYVISIAIPICTIYILIRYIYLYEEHQNSADEIYNAIHLESLVIKNVNSNIIELGNFSVEENNILFIESTDNYCNIYYKNEEEKVVNVLLRITLKTILEKITSNNIISCHRSFIINIEEVEDIKGNAQGYKLFIKNTDYIVPVSRKYVDEIKEYYNI